MFYKFENISLQMNLVIVELPVQWVNSDLSKFVYMIKFRRIKKYREYTFYGL